MTCQRYVLKKYIQIYADDTMIYVHDRTKEQVALKLTYAVSNCWLAFQFCLTHNVQKTACMYYKIKKVEIVPDILLNVDKLQIVQ